MFPEILWSLDWLPNLCFYFLFFCFFCFLKVFSDSFCWCGSEMHRWERSRCMAMQCCCEFWIAQPLLIVDLDRFSGSPNVQNPQPTTSLLVCILATLRKPSCHARDIGGLAPRVFGSTCAKPNHEGWIFNSKFKKPSNMMKHLKHLQHCTRVEFRNAVSIWGWLSCSWRGCRRGAGATVIWYQLQRDDLFLAPL